MANLKNITDLPIIESAEGVKLIVNDNGSAKQIDASSVGAQADWNIEDENHPAYIKNKPVKEWDLDIDISVTIDSETEESVINYTVNSINSYANIKNKIFNGEVPALKSKMSIQPSANSPSSITVAEGDVAYIPEGFDGATDIPEHLMFYLRTTNYSFIVVLTSDDVIQAVDFF